MKQIELLSHLCIMLKLFYSIYILIIQINRAFVSRLCSIGNDRDRSPAIYVGLHQAMLSTGCVSIQVVPWLMTMAHFDSRQFCC